MEKGFESKEKLLAWSNRVAPLLQFNSELRDKFITYQDIVIISRLKSETRQAFQIMKSQLVMAIEELKLLTNSENFGLAIRERIFTKGLYYDSSKMLKQIIQSAKDSLYIIDNYIDENILEFFLLKESQVKIEIITSKIPKELNHMIISFIKQHKEFEVRTSADYHDRFIIVDKKTFFHFGQSLKDLGNKVFMFSKIEEEENKKMLLNKWKNDWNESKKITI